MVVQRPPPWFEHQEEVSLLSMVNALLRHRRMIVVVSLAFSVLVVAFNLLQPSSYTAEVSFLGKTDDGNSPLRRFAGVASQFGVNIPTSEPGQDPPFYAELLQSRRILRSAAITSYTISTPEGDTAEAGDLIARLEIDASSREKAVARAVERLQDAVSVRTGVQTGLVEFEVTMPSPELAKAVADRMLELVNEFNVEVRQSKADEQRQFVERRLEKAREELRQAEDELERFLENNRRYENSPQLRFAYDRLVRRVDLRQQVVTSLAQSVEEARIEAVRSTPVISVVDRPMRPAEPDSRHILRNGIFALLLGGAIAVGGAYVAEYRRRAAEEGSSDYREFMELTRQSVRDLESLWSRVSRRFRAS